MVEVWAVSENSTAVSKHLDKLPLEVETRLSLSNKNKTLGKGTEREAMTEQYLMACLLLLAQSPFF